MEQPNSSLKNHIVFQGKAVPPWMNGFKTRLQEFRNNSHCDQQGLKSLFIACCLAWYLWFGRAGFIFCILKGAYPGLRQTWATKSPLKVIKISLSIYLIFCHDFLIM